MKRTLNEVDEFFILGHSTMSIEELSQKLQINKGTIQKFLDKQPKVENSKPFVAPSKNYTIMTEANSQKGDTYVGDIRALRPDRIHRPRG